MILCNIDTIIVQLEYGKKNETWKKEITRKRMGLKKIEKKSIGLLSAA
jgi:hypothetical protein